MGACVSRPLSSTERRGIPAASLPRPSASAQEVPRPQIHEVVELVMSPSVARALHRLVSAVPSVREPITVGLSDGAAPKNPTDPSRRRVAGAGDPLCRHGNATGRSARADSGPVATIGQESRCDRRSTARDEAWWANGLRAAKDRGIESSDPAPPRRSHCTERSSGAVRHWGSGLAVHLARAAAHPTAVRAYLATDREDCRPNRGDGHGNARSSPLLRKLADPVRRIGEDGSGSAGSQVRD